MRYFVVIFFLTFGLSAFAQQNIVESLQRSEAGEGIVTVHQDTQITRLLGNIHHPVEDGEQKMLKARGYRVQVYAGNNSRVARNEANKTAEKVREEFPELPVYVYLQAPRWLCRAGDFRSIEEADATMRRLKATGIFKEVSIVREQIKIPIN